jgi:methionyl-tRNA synthetase
MPETAEKIAKQFGFEIKSIDDCRPGLLGIKKIKRSEILFKKV